MAGWFGDGFSDACGGYGDEISLDFAGPGGLLVWKVAVLRFVRWSSMQICKGRFAKV
jgi:hypothetical protein